MTSRSAGSRSRPRTCKTPPDNAAQAQLQASIAEHDLLENLVVRPDESDADGIERFAVVAGGRRLAALKALAENGSLHADHPVPCKIAANGNAGELSLAENVVRIAMHPADQVVAFAGLAASGITVASIAARFGVSERTVEQRLRLGNAAPEVLDAYRGEQFDLETLMAFVVTTDHDRQRAVWEQVSAQGYRPSAWQVKRMLTEERVPAGAPMARFVGVEAYEPRAARCCATSSPTSTRTVCGWKTRSCSTSSPTPSSPPPPPSSRPAGSGPRPSST